MRISPTYLFCLFALVTKFFFAQLNLTQYVNPFIGTGGTGHTFPGAVLPFGMVQLSPDTRIDGSWEGCSGYAYNDKTIYGFSHTHLSGTGCSDWGDVMLMPMSTKPSVDNKIYSSKFSHTNEKAQPGYYEVILDDEKIKAELTVTLRTGIHRYTFPKTGSASVVLDLLHRDKLILGNIKLVDSVTVTGTRISEAWAKEQHCYFAIKFSRPIKKLELFKNKKALAKNDTTKADAAIFQFQLKDEQLLTKVAISSVSEEGALYNLVMEADHWDFDKYCNDADKTWNAQLEKILVSGTDKDKLNNFYTALYHTSIHPSLNMDYDNNYRGRDNKIHSAKGFTNYTVFSLWDTYRAVHPLFTIIERKRTSDFINTFLQQFKQSGRLPVWEISANETNCMIGYHSVSVIADAMAKGITGFDTNLVYRAVKAASTYTDFGIPYHAKKGFITSDEESESVSKTLEYCYDEWCIARIMEFLNRKNDKEKFIRRSQGWQNLFDPLTGFMRPRKNGDWLSPFDPKEVNNHYTEGNSWQYSFYVPHDIDGLIKFHGGDKNFEKKLDTLFTTGEKTSGRSQVDITGLIGQYAHGNEPSHHMAYLYAYTGSPHKTQEKVWKIMNDFYRNAPDGLIGNEDCGQMSAWYVFSALGFYPVCPGSSEYIIGKPLFNTAEITLEDGKKFKLTKSGDGELNYIHSVKINGNSSLKTSFDHQLIMNGGTMTFSFQSRQDSSRFGVSVFHRAHSSAGTTSVLTTPLIIGNKIFDNEQTIVLNSNGRGQTIVYTTDGSVPLRTSLVYKAPFRIDKNTFVKARVYSTKDSSEVSEANFFKRPNNWDISIKTKYNKQYNAGGDRGIIDGIYGDLNWKKGEWQGYQYQNFEAVIDLKEVMTFDTITANFLQDTRSWIIFPKKITVYLSEDNKKFMLLGHAVNTMSANDYTIQTKKLSLKNLKNNKARYVKIIAENFGTLPSWHQGKGDGAFIFIDEIEIK